MDLETAYYISVVLAWIYCSYTLANLGYQTSIERIEAHRIPDYPETLHLKIYCWIIGIFLGFLVAWMWPIMVVMRVPLIFDN